MDQILESSTALPVIDEIHTASILRTSGAILYYLIIYPLYWILWIIYTILVRPIWILLTYLAHPFIRFGQLVYALITLPLQIVTKFEAVLTYLLIASLIGGISGLFLYAFSTVISRLLGIDSETEKRMAKEQEARNAARSVAQYRADRARKKRQIKQEMRGRHHIPSPLETSGYVSVGLPSPAKSPLPYQITSQTILEEDDSSSPFEY